MSSIFLNHPRAQTILLPCNSTNWHPVAGLNFGTRDQSELPPDNVFLQDYSP
jgi:hypothetical protein